jgi:hypothetical protein
MKICEILNEEILNEKVIGNIAVGYHRTRNLQKLKSIKDGAFEIGDRGMYGPGVYFTYDFDDQQNGRMLRTYGQYIVKAKISLQDFIIFDEDVAKMVYGKKYSLLDQLKYFGVPKPELIVEKLNEITPRFHDNGQLYTSDLAHFLTNLIFTNKIKLVKNLKGMVFTGRSDGRVIVVYDQQIATPFAYARVIDLEKTYDQVKWNKLDSIPKGKETTKGVTVIQRNLADIKTLKKYLHSTGYKILNDGTVTYYRRLLFVKPLHGFNLYVVIYQWEKKNEIEVFVIPEGVDQNRKNIIINFGKTEKIEFVLPKLREYEATTASAVGAKEKAIEFINQFVKLISSKKLSIEPSDVKSLEMRSDDVYAKVTNVFAQPFATIGINIFGTKSYSLSSSFSLTKSLDDSYHGMFEMIDPQFLNILKINRTEKEINPELTKKFRTDLMNALA